MYDIAGDFKCSWCGNSSMTIDLYDAIRSSLANVSNKNNAGLQIHNCHGNACFFHLFPLDSL